MTLKILLQNFISNLNEIYISDERRQWNFPTTDILRVTFNKRVFQFCVEHLLRLYWRAEIYYRLFTMKENAPAHKSDLCSERSSQIAERRLLYFTRRNVYVFGLSSHYYTDHPLRQSIKDFSGEISEKNKRYIRCNSKNVSLL